jgi:Ca-activated chloride channel family protein
MKPTNRQQQWTKWVAAGLLTTTALVGGLGLFSDNVRRLFGGSADALAGTEEVTLRTKTFHVGGGDQKKSLKHFGEAYEDSYGGVSAAPVQPTVAPNAFVAADHDAKSTFAIDVDTASYTYARRQLNAGFRVEPSTVRVEEWVNAFRYDLEAPHDAPWAIHATGRIRSRSRRFPWR